MRTQDRDSEPIPFPTRRPLVKGDGRAMHLRLVADPPNYRSGVNAAFPTVVVRPSTASRETTDMYAHLNPNLNHVYAEARRRDLLAEAERDRRAELVAAARPSVAGIVVAALRQYVGTALVRVGERVQGAGAGEPAADVLPSIGTLRAAR